jgi:hypothetical protein
MPPPHKKAEGRKKYSHQKDKKRYYPNETKTMLINVKMSRLTQEIFRNIFYKCNRKNEVNRVVEDKVEELFIKV